LLISNLCPDLSLSHNPKNSLKPSNILSWPSPLVEVYISVGSIFSPSFSAFSKKGNNLTFQTPKNFFLPSVPLTHPKDRIMSYNSERFDEIASLSWDIICVEME